MLSNALPMRRLGRTQLSLSVLGLGGAPLGNSQELTSDEAARATVRAAYDSGIRYFDTAPLYGYGLSEHRLGHELRHFQRDSLVLSSKVGRLLKPVPGPDRTNPAPGFFVDPLPFQAVNDYSYDGLLRSVDDSLQRLGLNRIDIALIHNIDPANHSPAQCDALFEQCMSGAYLALRRLRDERVIGAIGVGNNWWQMCKRFAEAGDFDCFMLAAGYSLLDQSALPEFLSLCEQREIGVMIGAPLCSGILASGARQDASYMYRQAEPSILEKVRRMEQVCANHDAPLAAAALQFPLHHSAVTSVVPGCRTPEEVRANAQWLRAPVAAQLWAELKEEALIAAQAPTAG